MQSVNINSLHFYVELLPQRNIWRNISINQDENIQKFRNTIQSNDKIMKF